MVLEVMVPATQFISAAQTGASSAKLCPEARVKASWESSSSAHPASEKLTAKALVVDHVPIDASDLLAASSKIGWFIPSDAATVAPLFSLCFWAAT